MIRTSGRVSVVSVEIDLQTKLFNLVKLETAILQTV